MSYDSKIASARTLIEQHNSNVTGAQINFDQFLEKLRNMGGSSDGALMAASWEDLKDCGVPQIIARRLSFIFRENSKNGDSEKASAYISIKKAQTLTPKELVERYNPKDVKNTVGKRLKDISDGKPFIVFDNDGKVIVEYSSRLLEDIMNGLPSVETAFVEGRPFSVYKVGDRPDAYAEENPLYPGRALRSKEVCDQTGRSWKGISIETRQLLYLAISDTKELEIRTIDKANDILDRIVSQDFTLDNFFRPRYPQASKKYDELSKIGRLPLLKIKLGRVDSGSNKSNNPFGASENKIF